MNPKVLLMDEPFVSLDQPTAENLYEVLVNYWKKNPTTIILITHVLKEAILLGDRVLFSQKTPELLFLTIRSIQKENLLALTMFQ